jgi:hypothetical protein
MTDGGLFEDGRGWIKGAFSKIKNTSINLVKSTLGSAKVIFFWLWRKLKLIRGSKLLGWWTLYAVKISTVMA